MIGISLTIKWGKNRQCSYDCKIVLKTVRNGILTFKNGVKQLHPRGGIHNLEFAARKEKDFTAFFK